MSSSEEQFQDLIAQLIVRMNRMLKEHSYVLPLGLLISHKNEIEVLLAASDESDELRELVDTIQAGITEKAQSEGFVASCIAYPDYENGSIIALLENNENYCSRVTIPVNTEPFPALNPSDAEVEDGDVYVFPINQAS